MSVLTQIVDTNVVLVANGQHTDVSPQCVIDCATKLQAIIRSGRIALDSGYLILKEYQNKTQPRQGKGPGDAFVKWALQNNANTAKCDQVHIVEHGMRGFESFPDDAALSAFDNPDRKFVAVAITHPEHPPILQAADSKWLDWESDLAGHGVCVDFICVDDIKRFHRNKFGT